MFPFRLVIDPHAKSGFKELYIHLSGEDALRRVGEVMFSGTNPGFLLVDDHKDLALAYRTILEANGYTVKTASCGEEAQQVLRDGFKPSFILIDYRMPRMNGMELVQELKKSYHYLTNKQMVIFTSFSPDTPELSVAKKEGIRVVEKFNELDDFLNFINGLFLADQRSV